MHVKLERELGFGEQSIYLEMIKEAISVTGFFKSEFSPFCFASSFLCVYFLYLICAGGSKHLVRLLKDFQMGHRPIVSLTDNSWHGLRRCANANQGGRTKELQIFLLWCSSASLSEVVWLVNFCFCLAAVFS